jgi:tetratricopeptide (TPR) repeat protein
MRKIALLLLLTISQWVFAQNTKVNTDADKYLKDGLYLFEKEKYGSSQKSFQKYLSTNPALPSKIEAEFYIAFADLYLFRPSADFNLQNLITQYPSHQKANLAYYELGNFYYNKKSYENALRYFALIDFDKIPQDKVYDAKFKTGYSYFTKKDFVAAGKYFSEIKNSTSKYFYAANYYSGYINFKNGDYNEALKDLKVAEKNEAYKSIVPEMILNVLYLQKRYPEVISYGDSTLANNTSVKNKNDIRLLVADAYYYQEDYTNAIVNFKEFINVKNADKDLAYRYAYSNFKTANYDEAITYFKQVALNKDTIGQSAAYHLGLSYLKAGNKMYAITAFEQAKNQKFDTEISENATFYVAKLNYEQGKFFESINTLKDFKKNFPNSKQSNEANELLSESYLNTSNYLEAIKFIESLKTKTKRVTMAYQRVTFMQGNAYFNDSKYDEALKMYDLSLQNPHDDDFKVAAHFWKGETFSIGKQYENAINAYGNVIKYGDRNSDIYTKTRYGIAYAYYNTKQFEKARPHLEEYIKRTETAENKWFYSDAVLRLADCHYVAKRYLVAIEWYERAIREKNIDADYAYFQKGLALFAFNKFEEAKESFDYIITNYRNSRYYDDAQYQKAEVDFLNGAYSVAITGFSEVIQNSKDIEYLPSAHLKRALAYVNLKNYEATIKDYKIILDKYINHKTAQSALLGLQEALAMVNRPEEFNTYLDRFKVANPQSDALESIEYESNKTLYNNEKYELSAAGMLKYIETYPNNSHSIDAKYYLADSYYRLKQYTNALKYFRTVIDENKSEFINRSINRAAEIEMMNNNYQNSANFYTRLARIARNKKEQSSAEIGIVKAYFELGKYDTVMYYCNLLINQTNNPIFVQNTATLYAGKTAYIRKDFATATDYFLSMINTAKDENGAEAQYLLADIFYKEGNYVQSLEALYNLTANFITYTKWTNKAYLLIADNFVARNEAFQAKATLNSIIEKSKDAEFVEMAKKKLAEIEKAEAESTIKTTEENKVTEESVETND